LNVAFSNRRPGFPKHTIQSIIVKGARMNTEDHRKYPRVDSIHLSYICLDKSESVVQQAMARTINISDGGLLLETHFKMEKGYTLLASIGLRDETVDLKGQVVHVQPAGGGKYVAGIEITGIEGGSEELWLSFIRKISENESDSSAEK